MLDLSQIDVNCVEDRPLSGMWHCGPNPCWVTVTHVPTLTSIRIHSGYKSQHQTRAIAIELLELALLETRAETCSFPERLNKGNENEN